MKGMKIRRVKKKGKMIFLPQYLVNGLLDVTEIFGVTMDI
jgi:hypothetical protein